MRSLIHRLLGILLAASLASAPAIATAAQENVSLPGAEETSLRQLMQRREVIQHFVCAHFASHFDAERGNYLLQLTDQFTKPLNERDSTYIFAYFKGSTDNMLIQAAQRYESNTTEAAKYYFDQSECRKLLR